MATFQRNRTRVKRFTRLQPIVFKNLIPTIRWAVKVQLNCRRYNTNNPHRPRKSISKKVLQEVLDRVGRSLASLQEAQWLIDGWTEDTLQQQAKLEAKKRKKEEERQLKLQSKTATGKRAREQELHDRVQAETESQLKTIRAAKRDQVRPIIATEVRRLLVAPSMTCCGIQFNDATDLGRHRRIDCLKLPPLTACPSCTALHQRPYNEIRQHAITCRQSPTDYRCNVCYHAGKGPDSVFHKTVLCLAKHLKLKHGSQRSTGVLMRRIYTCGNCSRKMSTEKAILHEPRCKKDWSTHPHVCAECQQTPKKTFRFETMKALQRHNTLVHFEL